MRHRIIFLACLIPFFSQLPAHEDLNSTIRRLSAELSKAPTADLYCQRGLEYRAARERIHAMDDFRAALQQQEDHQGALKNLALLLSAGEQHAEAIAKAHQLKSSPETSLLLADLYFTAGQHAEALTHVIKGPLGEDHTYLLHAHLDPSKASDILKSGHQNTNSIVLRNAWIDALITEGDLKTSLPIVRKEIADSRFQATWRIKRARILLLHGMLHDGPHAAKADLTLSLKELKKRISPENPDLTLIHDQGLAWALIGEAKKAQKNLEILRQSDFSPLSYALLESLL